MLPSPFMRAFRWPFTPAIRCRLKRRAGAPGAQASQGTGLSGAGRSTAGRATRTRQGHWLTGLCLAHQSRPRGHRTGDLLGVGAGHEGASPLAPKPPYPALATVQLTSMSSSAAPSALMVHARRPRATTSTSTGNPGPTRAGLVRASEQQSRGRYDGGSIHRPTRADAHDQECDVCHGERPNEEQGTCIDTAAGTPCSLVSTESQAHRSQLRAHQ